MEIIFFKKILKKLLTSSWAHAIILITRFREAGRWTRFG